MARKHPVDLIGFNGMRAHVAAFIWTARAKSSTAHAGSRPGVASYARAADCLGSIRGLMLERERDWIFEEIFKILEETRRLRAVKYAMITGECDVHPVANRQFSIFDNRNLARCADCQDRSL